MRRRVVDLLRQQEARSIQDLVQALGQWALEANDTPQRLRGTFATADELERVRAYEEAPLLDEIALNAGYRAILINLGLVQIAYDRLEEYVASHGATLRQTLGLATADQLTYVCSRYSARALAQRRPMRPPWSPCCAFSRRGAS